MDYRNWFPGLQDDHLKLAEVIGTLPGMTQQEVPGIIRFFENPASPWSLPGAISLFRHDCMHILLGRGLATEDEAFVIGYTMGASDGENNRMTRFIRLFLRLRHPLMKTELLEKNVRDAQMALFTFVTRVLYRGAARFHKRDITVYMLGLALGERSHYRNPEKYPFEETMDKTVGEIRREFGITHAALEAVYRMENILAADSDTARRLNTNDNGPDGTYIRES